MNGEREWRLMIDDRNGGYFVNLLTKDGAGLLMVVATICILPKPQNCVKLSTVGAGAIHA